MREDRRQKRSRTIIMWVLGISLVAGLAILATKFSMDKIGTYSAIENPAKAFDPVPCSSQNLDIDVANVSGISGTNTQLAATLTNTGEKAPCYINVGYENFGFQIGSGDQVVFDSRVCQVGDKNRRLLINPGSSGTATVTWNGMNRGANCSGNTYAGDGMYVLNLFSGNEQLLDQGTIFQITGGQIVTVSSGVPTTADDPSKAEPNDAESSDSKIGETESSDDTPSETEPADTTE